MYYVIAIKHLSSGSVERAITPYDDKDTALRKFHEIFNTIGGGPTAITAFLLEEQIYYEMDENGQVISAQVMTTNIIKQDAWSVQIDVQPAESEA